MFSIICVCCLRERLRFKDLFFGLVFLILPSHRLMASQRCVLKTKLNATTGSHLSTSQVNLWSSRAHLLLGSLLLLQHHGCSLLGHLQLIVLRQALRGQPWGLHAHVNAGRRGPPRHHAHSLEHAYTRGHGWHGHRGHGRHTWNLERGGEWEV